jgi:hypothetical protein
MSDGNAKNAEMMRAIAEMRGLGRALAHAPESVFAAFERGRPIRSFPKEFSPIADPAGHFSAKPEGDA